MTTQLFPLVSPPCRCCGAMTTRRFARCRRSELITFDRCAFCGDESDETRRTWPVAICQNALYVSGLALALAVLWLLYTLTVIAFGDPQYPAP